MAVRDLAIFTICSNNYMPMAKVLLQSVRRHHPAATLYLCLADRRLPDPDFYPSGCHVVPAVDLEIPDFAHVAFRYDVMEFNTATKPFMIRHLRKRGHDAVIYFDPDIELFAPLDDIGQRLGDGASFLLTPHLLMPAEGDSDPDDVGIMLAGVYNLGFLGVGDAAEVGPILDWWARRLRYQCISAQGSGIFVDQKFFDLVPGFADHVGILRDPGYNVAYWNLAHRAVVQDGDGWLVDGRPLGFFHFSGFDPTSPSRMSKHSLVFRDAPMPQPVQALLRRYAAQVLANGFRAARDIPYAYGYFASGTPIPPRARHMFRALDDPGPGDPFVEFEARLPDLDPTLPPPMTAEELTRLVQAIHASSSWRITRPLRAMGRLLNGGR